MIGLKAKLIAVGLAILAGLAMVLRLFGMAKKAGADQEKARQADAWNQTQTAVDKATAAVDRLPVDAVRQRLRERAAGGASQGDPVRDRDSTPGGERS